MSSKAIENRDEKIEKADVEGKRMAQPERGAKKVRVGTQRVHRCLSFSLSKNPRVRKGRGRPKGGRIVKLSHIFRLISGPCERTRD